MECTGKRGQGGGRPFKAAIVRQQLYEWWVGLRYASVWQTLIENRRSRGKKSSAFSSLCDIFESSAIARGIRLRSIVEWRAGGKLGA